MRFFSKAKDGGPESPVDGYFLIEIKSLFSIVLLHFNFGARESFHTHAFNAFTLWLKGNVYEEIKGNVYEEIADGSVWPAPRTKQWKAGQFKFTPRNLLHRFITPSTGIFVSLFGNIVSRRTENGAWALSFRGPWSKTWREYTPATDKITTLTHGRKIVSD
jgi:hypothetical protein